MQLSLLFNEEPKIIGFINLCANCNSVLREDNTSEDNINCIDCCIEEVEEIEEDNHISEADICPDYLFEGVDKYGNEGWFEDYEQSIGE